jgi:hypothetical protein
MQDGLRKEDDTVPFWPETADCLFAPEGLFMEGEMSKTTSMTWKKHVQTLLTKAKSFQDGMVDIEAKGTRWKLISGEETRRVSR